MDSVWYTTSDWSASRCLSRLPKWRNLIEDSTRWSQLFLIAVLCGENTRNFIIEWSQWQTHEMDKRHNNTIRNNGNTKIQTSGPFWANKEKILRQSDRRWSDIVKSATLWAIDHNGKHRTLKLEELGDWSLLGGHLSDQLDVDACLEETVNITPWHRLFDNQGAVHKWNHHFQRNHNWAKFLQKENKENGGWTFWSRIGEGRS